MIDDCLKNSSLPKVRLDPFTLSISDGQSIVTFSLRFKSRFYKLFLSQIEIWLGSKLNFRGCCKLVRLGKGDGFNSTFLRI